MTVWRWVRTADDERLFSIGGRYDYSRDLNHVVEFDNPLFLIPGIEGNRAMVLTNDDRPAESVYAPRVTLHPADGSILMDVPGWFPVDGYSNQHGYDGPVMHASEQLAGGMARDLLAGVMGSGWFAVVAVETETCDDFTLYGECGVSSPPEDGDAVHECTEEPAGWMLVHRPVDMAGHDVRGQW